MSDMKEGEVGVLRNGEVYSLSSAVRANEELWNMVEEFLNRLDATLVVIKEE